MKSDASSGIYMFNIKTISSMYILIHIFVVLEYDKNNKKNLSSDDSSDSDSNNCFSNYGTQSKKVKFNDASCSKSLDSDSNISDDSLSKTNGSLENIERSGNKGMSLMVTTVYLI